MNNSTLILLASVASLLAVSSAVAAPFTWDPGLTNSDSGGGSGTWDATAQNWYNGSGDVAWGNTATDTAIFSGTAGTVLLGFNPIAASIVFSTAGYILQNSNTTTTVALGSGTQINLDANTTINLNQLSGGNSTSMSIAGKITGSGALNLTSTSATNRNITFTNTANDYSGGTTIGNGVRLNASAANTKVGTGKVTVASGAQLFLSNGTYSNDLDLNGTGWNGGDSYLGPGYGALRMSGSTLSGVVTLTGNTRIGGSNGTTNLISGPIGESGVGRTLTVGAYNAATGANTASVTTNITLSGDNTYTGATTLTPPNPTGAFTNTLSLTGSNQSSSYSIGAYCTLNIGKGTTGSVKTTATFTNNGALNVNLSGNQTLAAISGAGTFTQSGSGTTTLGGANTYTGATTVSAGKLLVSGTLSGTTAVNLSGGSEFALGADNVINNAATLNFTGSTFSTNGFDDVASTLTLGVGQSTLNFGSGFSTLSLGDSSAVSWTGTLSILNWSGSLAGGGDDQLFFGNSAAGLSGAQIAAIQFVDPAGLPSGTYGAQMLATGELVAVPEPSSFAAIAGGLGCLLSLRRRSRKV